MNTVWRENLVGRKFGEFGKSSVIRQTKTIEVLVTINNPLADLLVRQTFPHQTFLLYGS